MISIVSLLVAIIVMGLIYLLITKLPLPAPFNTVAIVVFIIICILILLSFIGVVNIGHIKIG